MLSLYRASQLAFPGENILDEAKSFTSKYLRAALEKSETFSSWNNKQNLSQEVTTYTGTSSFFHTKLHSVLHAHTSRLLA